MNEYELNTKCRTLRFLRQEAEDRRREADALAREVLTELQRRDIDTYVYDEVEQMAAVVVRGNRYTLEVDDLREAIRAHHLPAADFHACLDVSSAKARKVLGKDLFEQLAVRTPTAPALKILHTPAIADTVSAQD